MSMPSRRALADAGADWIVNAAAYTAVDLAEDERGSSDGDQRYGGRHSGAGRCGRAGRDCCICRPTSCSTAKATALICRTILPIRLSVYGSE